LTTRKEDMSEKQSLVQRARAFRPQRKLTTLDPEVIELSLAWVTDTLRNVQVKCALGTKGNVEVYNAMARGLREAYRQGRLQIKGQA